MSPPRRPHRRGQQQLIEPRGAEALEARQPRAQPGPPSRSLGRRSRGSGVVEDEGLVRLGPLLGVGHRQGYGGV